MIVEGQVADAPSLHIAGAWRRAAARYEVHDPALGKTIGIADDADVDDAHAALDAADMAASSWAATLPEERSRILRLVADAIRSDADALAGLLSRESGKPLVEARGELLGSARTLEWAAEEGRRVYGRVLPLDGGRRGLVVKEPIGIAVLVSPWNFPASMFLRKIAFALAAGCTAIAKPAEQTPLVARALVSLFAEAGCPPGVLNLLTTTQPDAVVRTLLDDDRVAKISFTGSTEVGLLLLQRGGGRLKSVSLELGGHAPAIVLDDADAAAAAAAVLASKFRNCGQSCIATNRLYVHSSLVSEVQAALLEGVEALRIGAGADADTDVGPLIDEQALGKLERQVADALEQGATVATGGSRLAGSRHENGYFYRPTILTGVTEAMSLAREEIFGPVLPIYEFHDEDDVVARANATDYGLAAYVYGRDQARLWRIAERLDFGVVGVNDPFPLSPELPFGGVKNSGLGREGGLEGIEAYLKTKAVTFGASSA